jgi:hypothetical protein
VSVLSTNDRAQRLLAAEDARARLVAALRDAGLGILARHFTARVGMIDGARVEVLSLTLNEVEALTAALGRARIDQP